MARKKRQVEYGGDLNMTPMIDIVFQLIIFFMVVSEMASSQLERIVLPKADQAQADPPQDFSRSLVVNVLVDGTFRIAGETVKKDDLEKRIRFEGIAAGTEKGDAKVKLSNLMLVIRADRNARYEKVSSVFDAAQKNGVYKTVVCAVKEEVK